MELFLPKGLLDYFEVTDIKQADDRFSIHLEERNIIPVEYSDRKLLSKGFYDATTIQDFPVRGKACYLMVKRRRWLIESTGQIVSRNWDLVAKGTRLTQEFASFLKGLH